MGKGENSAARPSALRVWLWAFRPRTLPLSVSAVSLGFSLAALYGNVRISVYLLALLTAVLLQILSNLANDYGDAVAGGDTAERIGPARMVATGLASTHGMKKAIILAALLAALCGLTMLLLALWGQWGKLAVYLLLGALSVAAAILYTVGKCPYGYRGLGDLMAGLFFGPVAVWGAAVLCGSPLTPGLILPGLAAGLCSTMVLNTNNMRDIETDRQAGKMTVAVRLGLQKAKRYHAIMAASVMLCWALFWLLERPAFLPCLVLGLPFLLVSRTTVRQAEEAKRLYIQLKNTVLSSAFLSMGMGLVCFFARNT